MRRLWNVLIGFDFLFLFFLFSDQGSERQAREWPLKGVGKRIMNEDGIARLDFGIGRSSWVNYYE